VIFPSALMTWRQRISAPLLFARDFFQEIVHQQRNVAGRSRRGDVDAHDVQPVNKSRGIVSRPRRLRALVRRGDDAHVPRIGWLRRRARTCRLQHAQDFSSASRASCPRFHRRKIVPGCLLEFADALRFAPVNAPRSWPRVRFRSIVRESRRKFRQKRCVLRLLE